MAMGASKSIGDLTAIGADLRTARATRPLQWPRAACALAFALTIAFAWSVAFAARSADAAVAQAPATSLATPPTATAASSAKPGYATLAGVPELEPGRVRLNLYCNGESTCRGWFTLVAGGLRLVVYRWVGYHRVITHVVHHLLLGASNFEIAPGATDAVTLTLGARNRRVLNEVGGLPATLAGKDLVAASFKVKLPMRKYRQPAPVIEHGVRRG